MLQVTCTKVWLASLFVFQNDINCQFDDICKDDGQRPLEAASLRNWEDNSAQIHTLVQIVLIFPIILVMM
jgi:hypothetical protein